MEDPVARLTALVDSNSPETKALLMKTLSKIAENILKAPTDPKKRKLRLTNVKVRQSLLDPKGGNEVLAYMGFEEQDGFLVLPVAASLDNLSKAAPLRTVAV